MDHTEQPATHTAAEINLEEAINRLETAAASLSAGLEIQTGGNVEFLDAKSAAWGLLVDQAMRNALTDVESVLETLGAITAEGQS